MQIYTSQCLSKGLVHTRWLKSYSFFSNSYNLFVTNNFIYKYKFSKIGSYFSAILYNYKYLILVVFTRKNLNHDLTVADATSTLRPRKPDNKDN